MKKTVAGVAGVTDEQLAFLLNWAQTSPEGQQLAASANATPGVWVEAGGFSPATRAAADKRTSERREHARMIIEGYTN